MTPLNSKLTRRADASLVRDGGRLRPLVVTLYPNGMLGLRPHKTQREEFITLDAAWHAAIKMRVSAERRERKAAKKAKVRK